MTYTLAFLCAFALDYLWTKLHDAREKRDRRRAVGWGFLVDVVATLAIWVVVDDRWTLLPSLAGGALGLWFGIGAAPPQPPRSKT